MKFLFFMILISTFLSCKIKDITPNNYNKNILIVGNGGGFTGASTTYYILESGDVFQSGLTDTSFIKVGSLPKKQIQHQFSMYEQLQLGEKEINNPGNRYYFLGMKNGNSEHRLQWGNGQLENKNIEIMHSNMMGMIKTVLNKKSNK